MKRYLLLFALLSGQCFAQGVWYSGNITTVAGNVPAGARAPVMTLPNSIVTVCAMPAGGSPCSNTVPIYNDQALTSAQANPLTTDSQGRFGFWIAPGVYTYSVQTPDGQFVGTYPISLDSPQGPQGPGGIGCGAANCIIAAPTGDQVITQVAGSTLAVNSLENVLYADQFAGADAGAKINAADTRLGASPGTIIYNAPVSATASTNVVLSANHKLILQSPITWTSSITLPDNSSGQDISCPALQTLGYTGPDISWIVGTGNSGVNFHDCRFAGILTSGLITRGMLLRGSTGITVANNTATESLLVAFLSTAAYTTCADGSSCQYPNVTDSNSPKNIKVYGNKGSATGTGGGAFIFLDYANHATVTGNVASGYADSVMYWGGDSCVSGCTAGQNGAMTNERKMKNLIVSGNVFTGSLNACIWGSMGQYVTISGNTCVGKDAGTDVGIDLEGTWDATVSHNTVSGYVTGDLTTFWLSTRVTFNGNVASQDNASYPLISTHNATNVPDGLTQSFVGNTLNCTAATVCDAVFQSAEIYNFTDNVLHNTRLDVSGLNISQVFMTGNDLAFDLAADYGIRAQSTSGSSLSTTGQIVIRNNNVLSSAAQAAGAQAISAFGADANHPSNIRIEGNTAGGVNAFPVGIECDAASLNAGIPTYCSILNNAVAGTVVANNGSSGAPVHVHNDPQIASATPCAITPGAIGNNCGMTITLPSAESDTNYVITGCEMTNAGDGASTVGSVANTSKTQISVTIVALDTTYAGGTGTVNCMVTHP